MPTLTDNPSVQRAQMLRDAYHALTGHSSSIANQVFTFFAAYPPLAQGLYYILIGAIPLLSTSFYQTVTGHQGDPWLIDAVGVLTVVIGCTLCVAAYRRKSSPEVLVLAFGSAIGLTLVDVHLVQRGVSLLYLVDAALQIGLLGFWVFAGWLGMRRLPAAPSAVNNVPVTASAPPTP